MSHVSLGKTLVSFPKRLDPRTKSPFELVDGGMAKEWNVDPLEIPLGPMTRARAKRFKEALNVLIQDAKVEGAHVFNYKEETKMVHVIKVNPDLDQDPWRLTC